MPFGPKNAPAFYTAMMQFLRDDWTILFNETRNTINLSNSPTNIVCDDRIIIDDILLFSNHIPTLLHYFSCVAQVFTKFRLSFKLGKCDFLKERVEYVGHDLTANGNCPAASKFSLLQDWPLPPHGISLLSFIGLCCFYNRYCPWFETNIKPLRKLQRAYHCKTIPIMGWTPSLIQLFGDCKSNLITSPLLLRYDSSKPTFLKTDWSAGGMGYILMQPDDSPESLAAIKHLSATGECLFDVSLDGPRLRPVLFGSRSNKSYERDYHSFVGEVACGRWSIAACRKYLWGTLFYWICDCNAVKEVLEYDGSIHQIKRWSQELMAYEFVCIHRSNRMMKDVDGVCRHIDPLIHRYLVDANVMRCNDEMLRPFAYNFNVFSQCSNPRHVSKHDVSTAIDTVSTIPTPSVLYHYPIRFSSPLHSTPTQAHISSLTGIVVPPNDVVWLSFDSVVHSLGSHLLS